MLPKQLVSDFLCESSNHSLRSEPPPIRLSQAGSPWRSWSWSYGQGCQRSWSWSLGSSPSAWRPLSCGMRLARSQVAGSHPHKGHEIHLLSLPTRHALKSHGKATLGLVTSPLHPQCSPFGQTPGLFCCPQWLWVVVQGCTCECLRSEYDWPGNRGAWPHQSCTCLSQSTQWQIHHPTLSSPRSAGHLPPIHKWFSYNRTAKHFCGSIITYDDMLSECIYNNRKKIFDR